MAIIESYELAAFDESDPDDYRPASRWALLVDPGDAGGGRVDDLTVIVEEIAPGDRIPLHVHPINELIVIQAGVGEVTLGDEVGPVGAGATVFVPAGAPHGTRNAGTSPLRLLAVFPSQRIGIRYRDRNPAPGTEGDEPRPEFTIDAREAAAGG